jgi:hypothetical protein
MAGQSGILLLAFASIVILAADHRDTHENNLFCLTILTELCESSHAFTAQCLSNFYEVQK